jgi:hypothetical protein
LKIPKQQILLELYVALRATPMIWWETHKEGIENWRHCKRLMQIKFEIEEVMHKYTGMSSLTNHVAQFMTTWRQVSKLEWTHWFIHTLEMVPKNWYLELEVRRGTTNWEELTHNFKVTFNFEVESPLAVAALQVIRSNIFMEEYQIEIVHACSMLFFFI